MLGRDAGERCERDLPERASGCGQRHAPDLPALLADEALPEPVVLAVYRPQPLAGPAGKTAHEMPRGDQDLLVREGDAFAVRERRDGRTQRGDARRRHEHEVGRRVGRERGERVGAERRSCGRELHREPPQLVDVAVRAERDHPQPVGMRADDLERLPPDGAGGAEDGKSDGFAHGFIIPSGRSGQ